MQPAEVQGALRPGHQQARQVERARPRHVAREPRRSVHEDVNQIRRADGDGREVGDADMPGQGHTRGRAAGPASQ